MPIKSLKPMVTRFRPLGDRLVVRRIEKKEASGIILPEQQVKVGLVEAEVLLIGSKVSPHHGFRPGDRVRMPPQLGYMKFILNGEQVDIVPTEQVYAKGAA